MTEEPLASWNASARSCTRGWPGPAISVLAAPNQQDDGQRDQGRRHGRADDRDPGAGRGPARGLLVGTLLVGALEVGGPLAGGLPVRRVGLSAHPGFSLTQLSCSMWMEPLSLEPRAKSLEKLPRSPPQDGPRAVPGRPGSVAGAGDLGGQRVEDGQLARGSG
jgi:hypothetical protein